MKSFHVQAARKQHTPVFGCQAIINGHTHGATRRS